MSPGKRATFRATELARLGGPEGESRHPVKLAQVPKSLVDAVLAVEDARFYEHEGIDPLGVLRAIVVNAFAGETRQGGSTLTQQLVKNLFLTQERSLSRKGKEAILALALEQRVSKDRILELYLNEIYLGQHGARSICGMDEAARTWFGKPVGRLELEESATLAGMVAGPNLYSPVRHADRAKERRDFVIDRMVEVGFLARPAGDAAKAKPLVVHASGAGRRAPWAVDLAFEKAEQQLGSGSVIGRGLEIDTTIAPALQRLAERTVASSLEDLVAKHPQLAAAEGKPGVEMALVAMRPSDGAVLALVGGHDYAETPFDRATHGKRQLGSTVKLLSALLAFEADPALSGASFFDDSPLELVVDGEVWAPTDYDGKYLGPISLRRAIADSRNIPAVLLAQHVGMDRLARGWKALGLSGATARPSSALGAFEATPLELAGAFTVFPGRGVVARPRIVAAIEDGKGSTLWSEEPVTTRVASTAATFLAADLGVEVIRFGHGRERRAVRLAGRCRRQDRYHRRKHRRVVRRLHARSRRRGVGRIRPGTEGRAHGRGSGASGVVALRGRVGDGTRHVRSARRRRAGDRVRGNRRARDRTLSAHARRVVPGRPRARPRLRAPREHRRRCRRRRTRRLVRPARIVPATVRRAALT